MSSELDRIIHPPIANDTPDGIGLTRFMVSCPGNASQVLSLARRTLSTSLQLTKDCVFEESVWISKLPKEFVSNCADRHSQEEIESDLSLPVDLRAEKQHWERWSVYMFMNSFRPDLEAKQWRWWNAEKVDENTIRVDVVSDDWPFPSEALRWLFRGSGASDVEIEA